MFAKPNYVDNSVLSTSIDNTISDINVFRYNNKFYICCYTGGSMPIFEFDPNAKSLTKKATISVWAMGLVMARRNDNIVFICNNNDSDTQTKKIVYNITNNTISTYTVTGVIDAGSGSTTPMYTNANPLYIYGDTVITTGKGGNAGAMLQLYKIKVNTSSTSLYDSCEFVRAPLGRSADVAVCRGENLNPINSNNTILIGGRSSSSNPFDFSTIDVGSISSGTITSSTESSNLSYDDYTFYAYAPSSNVAIAYAGLKFYLISLTGHPSSAPKVQEITKFITRPPVLNSSYSNSNSSNYLQNITFIDETTIMMIYEINKVLYIVTKKLVF